MGWVEMRCENWGEMRWKIGEEEEERRKRSVAPSIQTLDLWR